MQKQLSQLEFIARYFNKKQHFTNKNLGSKTIASALISSF